MDPWASPWGDGQEEVPSRPELRAQDLTNTQSSQTSPPTEAKEEGTTADALSADPWGGALPAPPGEPDGGGGADVWGATGSTVPETQKVKADADSAETSSVSEPAASTWAGERNAASSPDEAKRTPTAETTVPLPVSSAGFGSTSPVATRANFDPWGSGASADPLPSPSKSKGASTSGTKDSVTLSASPWGSGETESRNAEPVHARPISVEANPALGLGSGADGLSASLAAGEDGGWGGSMSDIGGWASTGTALGIAELGQEGQGEEGEGAADDVWGAEARQRAEQSKSMPEDQRDTLMVEARHVARDALGEPSANSFRTSGLGEQGWNGLFGEGGTLRPRALNNDDGTVVRDIFAASPSTSQKTREALTRTANHGPKLSAPSTSWRTHTRTSSALGNTMIGRGSGDLPRASGEAERTAGGGWEQTSKKPASGVGGIFSSLFGGKAGGASSGSGTPADIVSAADDDDDRDNEPEPAPRPSMSGSAPAVPDLLGTQDPTTAQNAPTDSTAAPPSAVSRFLGRWGRRAPGAASNKELRAEVEGEASSSGSRPASIDKGLDLTGDDLSWLGDRPSSSSGDADFVNSGQSTTNRSGALDDDWFGMENALPNIGSAQSTRARISSTAAGTVPPSRFTPALAPIPPRLAAPPGPPVMSSTQSSGGLLDFDAFESSSTPASTSKPLRRGLSLNARPASISTARTSSYGADKPTPPTPQVALASGASSANSTDPFGDFESFTSPTLPQQQQQSTSRFRRPEPLLVQQQQGTYGGGLTSNASSPSFSVSPFQSPNPGAWSPSAGSLLAGSASTERRAPVGAGLGRGRYAQRPASFAGLRKPISVPYNEDDGDTYGDRSPVYRDQVDQEGGAAAAGEEDGRDTWNWSAFTDEPAQPVQPVRSTTSNPTSRNATTRTVPPTPPPKITSTGPGFSNGVRTIDPGIVRMQSGSRPSSSSSNGAGPPPLLPPPPSSNHKNASASAGSAPPVRVPQVGAGQHQQSTDADADEWGFGDFAAAPAPAPAPALALARPPPSGAAPLTKGPTSTSTVPTLNADKRMSLSTGKALTSDDLSFFENM